MKIRLRQQYMRPYLNSSEMRDRLHDYADKIADKIRDEAEAHGAEVTVTDWDSDRAVVQVAIDAPHGTLIEAKYGLLRNAAAESGLDVNVE